MEYLSYSQGTCPSTQLQPGHRGEFPNPQDYYTQEVEWRAQEPPSDCEGGFPGSQDVDLQKSGPSKAEFSDLDSLIMLR
jgi:hypothetical protein